MLKLTPLLLLVLATFPLPALSSPCGLDGSIEERITQCDESHSLDENRTWNLIMRNDKEVEVWQAPNLVVWGDLLDFDSQKRAREACKKPGSLHGLETLSAIETRLPDLRDFQAAELTDIREVLPNMNRLYWADDRDYTFSGQSGAAISIPRTKLEAFRCIGLQKNRGKQR